MKHRVNTVVGT